MDQEHGIVGKELMYGRAAREMMEGRKEARRAPRVANPIGTVTRTKGAREKARAAIVKIDTATTANCPHLLANSIDEEDDQTSSWKIEPEGENAEELASLETHDEEGEWCWPKKG